MLDVLKNPVQSTRHVQSPEYEAAPRRRVCSFFLVLLELRTAFLSAPLFLRRVGDCDPYRRSDDEVPALLYTHNYVVKDG